MQWELQTTRFLGYCGMGQGVLYLRDGKRFPLHVGMSLLYIEAEVLHSPRRFFILNGNFSVNEETCSSNVNIQRTAQRLQIK
jgi:hypothetical protein